MIHIPFEVLIHARSRVCHSCDTNSALLRGEKLGVLTQTMICDRLEHLFYFFYHLEGKCKKQNVPMFSECTRTFPAFRVHSECIPSTLGHLYFTFSLDILLDTQSPTFSVKVVPHLGSVVTFWPQFPDYSFGSEAHSLRPLEILLLVILLHLNEINKFWLV